MKIEEIQDLTIEDLTKQLEEAGINKNRLSGAMESNHLQPKGTFTHFEVKGEDNFKHVRVYTDKGDSISMSRIQARGTQFEDGKTKDSLNEADFMESQNNGFFLRSNMVVNSHLQGNQAAILKRIIGKKFEAKKVAYMTTVYNPDGYDSWDEVEIAPQESYELVIKG